MKNLEELKEMKDGKYDICLYCAGEEVGGFHIESSQTIDELVEIINEEYGDIEFDRISINKI